MLKGRSYSLKQRYKEELPRTKQNAELYTTADKVISQTGDSN